MIYFKPITNRKIRMGIVGCGRISHYHVDAIQKHAKDIELIAMCDAYQPNLEKFCQQHSVRGFQTLDAMLKATDLDLVALCTPSGLHARQATVVAEAGKHVITEKPMATRWRDGLAMTEACDKANVNLFVVKQNRFNNTLQVLKKAIDQNRFGKIYMVNINVFWYREQSYYDQASWRGTWEYDGGALMNQASHYIDLLHWLIGPVQSVHAMTATLARKIETEDTGVLNVRWRSGALGSVNVTVLTYPKDLEGSITILGEKGTVRVGGVALNKIEHWEFADKQAGDAEIKEANYETSSVYGFGHPLYYQNVIEVLRGQANPETNGKSGLKSLELLIAAYRSARDGKEVHLPLEY
ncbi:MAG: oxidoreductase [Gammaproteobacteria bacterium RIFCSPHIGHO2_12_FULL_35_23]|nr:MAG: oxidoreductase [Gammaproteobacteria bacterium RIFCSPHIGHO2_12_FULL_35_23]